MVELTSAIIDAVGGDPTARAQNFSPEVYNYDPAYLAKWRVARSRVRAGDARAKVATVGDSTTAGQGSGGSALNSLRSRSYPAYLAKALAGSGIPARHDNIFGSSGFSTNYPLYEPRVTANGWTPGSAISLGGTMYSTNGTTAFRYTATGSLVDTFIVYLARNPGLGTVNISIDGGAATSVATAGTGGVIAQVITTTAGTSHYVEVARTTGGDVYIVGIEAYNSAVPDVAVLNVGSSGTRLGDWVANTNVGFSPLPALQVLAPDLSIINLGINDWTQANVDVAAVKVQYQTLITGAKVSGDVIIVVPVPSQITRATVAQQAALIAPMYDLAKTNNCVLIDMTRRFGSWATANAGGFTYDDLHYNALGYADEAQTVCQMLLR